MQWSSRIQHIGFPMTMTHQASEDLFNSVFKDYTWINRVRSHGLTPTLIRCMRDNKAYIYLFLAQSSETATLSQEFQTLRESLHSHKSGRTFCEIEFDEFILNISHTIWTTFIYIEDFSLLQKADKVEVGIYGHCIHQVTPIVEEPLAIIDIPHHDNCMILWKNYVVHDLLLRGARVEWGTA
ncbi:hypothetical protein BGZ63DRAFT_173131 [Mariannaea sp. PMI_226]|nr:hypothetical protein BGZ63DRAFT_173131 [Mariannaea sp. PMI_226]